MNSIAAFIFVLALAPETTATDVASAAAALSVGHPKLRVGVFQISVVGLDPGLEQTAIDALATAVAAVEGFEVVSKTELSTMIAAEMVKDLTGCDEVSCLSEIGSAAGVERIIGGSVSKLEGTLVVSLQLVNSAYATVENRVTLKWEGAEGELANLLGAASEMLVIPANVRRAGGVRVSAIPLDTGVSIDAKVRGVGPMTVDDLQVGIHTLALTAPGYLPYQAPFIVRVGATTQLELQLEPEPEKPIYGKWWFWTTAGAVVVGGAIGGWFLINAKQGVEITTRPPSAQGLTP